MLRIPIIPKSYTAKKASSLFCDDSTHYSASGEPKRGERTTAEARECCTHIKKLLLVDKAASCFCIVHDPGVGKEPELSGQWWEYISYAGTSSEIIKAELDYERSMDGQPKDANWWDCFDDPRLYRAQSKEPRSTHGLHNNNSATASQLGQGEEDWEVVEGAEVEEDYVKIEKSGGGDLKE